MYKFVIVVLALLAVASAQYLASPYAYSSLGYRSGIYGSPLATTYNTGAYAPYAYGGYGGLLYK